MSGNAWRFGVTCSLIVVLGGCAVTLHETVPYRDCPEDQGAINTLEGFCVFPAPTSSIDATYFEEAQEAWGSAFKFCDFRQRVINSEVAQVKGRQRRIRWFWGAVSALSTAASSVYTLAEGDNANAKITAGLALGAGLTALPAFLSQTDQERIAELSGKLANIDNARRVLLDTYTDALQAAARWNNACDRLQAIGVTREILVDRLTCPVGETYQGTADVTEEQLAAIRESLEAFTLAEASLKHRIVQFDQVCRA